MNIDKAVIATAGSMVLISTLLSIWHSQYWLGLTAFVGINLLQSAFSGLCPLVRVLKMVGLKSGPAYD